jgi:hypothetical protein
MRSHVVFLLAYGFCEGIGQERERAVAAEEAVRFAASAVLL